MFDTSHWDVNRRTCHRPMNLLLILLVLSGCGSIVQNSDGTSIDAPFTGDTAIDDLSARDGDDLVEVDSREAIDVTLVDASSDTGSCRADSNALFCGSNHCTPCTAPAHAITHCSGNSCSADLRCEIGFEDCDRQQANGCETETTNDIANCGRCGARCAAPQNARALCSLGVCAFECAEGYDRRGDQCVFPLVGLRRPLSASVIVGDRPSFRWAPLAAAEEYHFELCSARDCLGASVVETSVVRGANTYLLQRYRLNSRIHFWRVHALRGGVIRSTSATWEFRSVNPMAAETQQRFATLLDLDGDGREEVIANDTTAGEPATAACSVVSWNPVQQVGRRLVQLDESIVPLDSCEPHRLGDSNGDGRSDWLAISYAPMSLVPRLYFVAGQSDFGAMVRAARPIPDPTGYVWVGDVNDDGFQDSVGSLRVGNQVQLVAYFGSANGPSAVGVPISPLTDGRIASASVASDLDRDGKPELLVYGHPGGPGVYPWNGTRLADRPLFAPLGGVELPGTPLGDVNGDGISDSTERWSFRLLDANGQTATEIAVQTPLVLPYFKGLLPLGDINRDGIEDAAGYGWLAETWWIEVYLGSRNIDELRVPDYRISVSPPSFGSGIPFLPGKGTSSLDFRGDGDSYLAIGGLGQRVVIYQIGGDPMMAAPPTVTVVYQLDRVSMRDSFGNLLVLAPNQLWPSADRQTTLSPAAHFLSPSLDPYRRFRLFFSSLATPNQTLARAPS